MKKIIISVLAIIIISTVLVGTEIRDKKLMEINYCLDYQNNPQVCE